MEISWIIDPPGWPKSVGGHSWHPAVLQETRPYQYSIKRASAYRQNLHNQRWENIEIDYHK